MRLLKFFARQLLISAKQSYCMRLNLLTYIRKCFEDFKNTYFSRKINKYSQYFNIFYKFAQQFKVVAKENFFKNKYAT